MANIRAMVIFQGGSNLAEDRFVNTFHFLSPQDYTTDSPLISEALNDFYEVDPAAGDPVGAYLSPYVARAYEIRTYDMDVPGLPRVPAIYTHTLPAVKSGALGTVPEECAVCLSYHGIPPINARRRGRIYLGPLNSAAVSGASAGAPSRVDVQTMASLNYAAVALVDTGLGWCVYSPTAETRTLITAGWTDNAFDTQRRRGVNPTNRVLWNV